MANTSNTATADRPASDKPASDKASVKTLTEKVNEKVAEKRRALGRGLESLLPGPRVVSSPAATTQQSSAIQTSTLPTPTRPPADQQGAVPPAAAASAASSASVGESESSASSSSAIKAISAVGDELGERASSGEGTAEPVPHLDDVVQIPIDQIKRNPYQTRMMFDEQTLTELADSIRVQGVLQPISVRPAKDGIYTLILGERRLRAAKLAGLETIPAIVKRVSDQQAAEMTVVENLQRQDLNCIDQASSFAILSQKFNLTQEQIGKRVGMSRQSVANYMRLLTLSEGIVGALQKSTLTFSHAKLLLMIQDDVKRWTVAQKAIAEKMSVAKLEELVIGVSSNANQGEKRPGVARWMDPNVKAAQRSLEEVLGMRVRIRDQHGRGKILIEYATIEDFDRVVKMLRGSS